MLDQKVLLVCAFLVLLPSAQCTSPDSAVDWPRFRGPNGSGVTEVGNLPVVFGPARNVVFRTRIPPGNSSPVLDTDQIYLTGHRGSQLVTLALDRFSGEVRWERAVTSRHQSPLYSPNTPASPTPVVDGRAVYVFFQGLGVVAYDRDGGERWRYPLGPFNNIYGMAASPILVHNSIVLVCDQQTGSFMLGLDKDSGELLWRVERPETANGYSTPITDPGSGHLLVPGSFHLTGYKETDGSRVWQVEELAWLYKSSPVLGDGVVFVSGYGSTQTAIHRTRVELFEEVLQAWDRNSDGQLILEESQGRVRDWFVGIDRDGDSFVSRQEWNFYRKMMSGEGGLFAIRLPQGDAVSKVVWHYSRTVAEIPSVLLYRGVLYMINDGGRLIALDPQTGEVIKQGRLKGATHRYFASPVAGDGKIYFTSQRGAVAVVEAGRDWQLLGVNHLDEECHATPALADGLIYIRTSSHLYCFHHS